MNKKKIAFICVHNSCRSQIAEALSKHWRNKTVAFWVSLEEDKQIETAVRLSWLTKTELYYKEAIMSGCVCTGKSENI